MTASSTASRHSSAGNLEPLTDTAQLLGISTSQLSSDLQSGQTLSSLSSCTRVSSSDLLSAVESDLKANAPSGAPALPSSHRQMASDFINDTTPSTPASASATVPRSLVGTRLECDHGPTLEVVVPVYNEEAVL